MTVNEFVNLSGPVGIFILILLVVVAIAVIYNTIKTGMVIGRIERIMKDFTDKQNSKN